MIAARVSPCPAGSRAAPPFLADHRGREGGSERRSDLTTSHRALPRRDLPRFALRTETNSPDGCACLLGAVPAVVLKTVSGSFFKLRSLTDRA